MNKPLSIFYVVSDIDKSLGLEWTANAFKKRDLEVRWVLLNKGESELEKYLLLLGVEVHRIPFSSKRSLPLSLLAILRLVLKYKPRILHTHLFDASLCGLLAAWICRVPKRIVTRHHATFHHRYFPRAVFYDKIITALATHVVAVSESVKQILVEKENTAPAKVSVCHHGFDFNYFSQINETRVVALREKYALLEHQPVIGIISRYEEWKGIQYIIPAFDQLLQNYPDAKLVLANAKGRYSESIQGLLKPLPDKSYIEIPFESDLKSLYSCFDVFIHCPIDEDIEAFGQIYVEALIMKIPSIFTLSGIAKEFIRHEHNALVVPFQNSDAIYQSMQRILQEKNLSAHLTENGFQDVKQRFDLEQMINCLIECYRK